MSITKAKSYGKRESARSWSVHDTAVAATTGTIIIDHDRDDLNARQVNVLIAGVRTETDITVAFTSSTRTTITNTNAAPRDITATVTVNENKGRYA